MERRTFTKLLGGVTAAGLGASRRGRASREISMYPRVEIESWDGTTLVASLYVPDGRRSAPHPAIVAAHGYGFTRDSLDDVARLLAQDGYVVLAPDARGFGDSGGESSTNGPKEVADVLVHVNQLAEGRFQRPDGESVEVDVRPTSNGPAVGMTGESYGGAIQLLTAAATPEWFRGADDVTLAAIEDATPHLSLSSSPLDAIVPRITWQDLARAIAPNDVLKSTWSALLFGLGAEGYERDDRPTTEGQDPRLYEFAAEAAATNELPTVAESYFAKRSPDLAAIAANGVPTLIVQEWRDSLFPPGHGIRAFRGIRGGSADVPVALTLSPVEVGSHNQRSPLAAEPAGPITEYLGEISTAWLDRFVAGDASRWNGQDFPMVSLYQQQYPDVPEEHHDGDWPGWRRLETFPPADATSTSLPLSAAATTDRTPLVNTVAPTSGRGAGGHVTDPTADGPASSAAFDFEATESVDVATTPELRLSVTPLGPDAFVFAKVAHLEAGSSSGSVIDSQVMPARIRDSTAERTTVDFDLVPFQRYFEPGDRLRLVLATTDNGYMTSREAAGVVVHHGASDDALLEIDVVCDREAPFEGRPLDDGVESGTSIPGGNQ